MKKISKTKRPRSAESIARLADSGKDVSSYFNNKGKMMSPLNSTDLAITKEVIQVRKRNVVADLTSSMLRKKDRKVG